MAEPETPWGLCAFCDTPLPAPRSRTRPRVVCDDPACVRQANAYGARILNARRHRRSEEKLRTGAPHRCPRCGEEKPLTPDYWYTDRRDPETGEILRFMRWCKECKKRDQRDRQKTPEHRAKARARRAATRLAETPEQAAARRAKENEMARRYRAARKDKVRAARAAWWARLKADPPRHARYLEARRLQHRTRRIQQGAALDNIRAITPPRSRDRAPKHLPAKPLADAVEAIISRANMASPLGYDDGVVTESQRETICERAGVSDRRLRAWKSGESPTVHVDKADAVVTALDLLWFEVWTEPGDYEIARAAFETGEALGEAA